jgi:Fe2+ transport system protein FeoA
MWSSELPLSKLSPGARGRIARVVRDLTGRSERLAALGVTRGAAVRVLQTFPGFVFECDQTELAVERTVARSILVELDAEGGFSNPRLRKGRTPRVRRYGG